MVPKACRVIPKFHGEGIGRLVFYPHPRPLPYASGCPNVTQFFLGTKGQGLQGFQEIEGLPLLAGAFKKFGVSKIQGLQGKYIKYELGQKYHRTCMVQSSLRSVLFMGKIRTDWKVHTTARRYFQVWE